MLHDPPSRNGALAIAARLLSDAEASLDQDVGHARACLQQLASLIAEPPGPEAGHGAVEEQSRGGLAPWQVRRVSAHVETHLARTITVSELAGVVRLSDGHFCRAFKVAFGLTPHSYIVQQRVARAQILMLTTRETLSQIAAMCGLSDQAHLTKLFRRFVGSTPLQWRRAHMQGE